MRPAKISSRPRVWNLGVSLASINGVRKADLVSVCGFDRRDIYSQRESEPSPLVGDQIFAHSERLHTFQGLFDGLRGFYPDMLPAHHHPENVYWGNHAEIYSKDLREKSVRFWTETLTADRIAKHPIGGSLGCPILRSGTWHLARNAI